MHVFEKVEIQLCILGHILSFFMLHIFVESSISLCFHCTELIVELANPNELFNKTISNDNNIMKSRLNVNFPDVVCCAESSSKIFNLSFKIDYS